MSDVILKSIDINNFRSIRGRIHAPLDGKVVLVHGENGAGKTSLLSAMELAVTGKVQSLERADPAYEKQLLHRSANEGSILLKTLVGTSEQAFEAVLRPGTVQSITAFDKRRASFFQERAFLPQSLLGQLLQIYQDAGNDSQSPLAQFVGKLLGLDRLDAIEAGLKPLGDVRNVRRNVDGWLAAEDEKSRLSQLISDRRKMRDALDGEIRSALVELAILCGKLKLSIAVSEETLDEVTVALLEGSDSEALARLSDQQRKLGSFLREIEVAQGAVGSDAFLTPAGADEARKAFAQWEAEYGERLRGFRSRIEGLLSEASLLSDPGNFAESALKLLHAERKQLSDRASQMRANISRQTVAQDERDVALRQRGTIDEEVSQLSSTAGSLASALAELTSFISNDICPVCDRDFGELSRSSLSEHVHTKVRTLSASAERLLTLGRARSELQVNIERLSREIELIAARELGAAALAELDRRLASIGTLIDELESMIEVLHEGGRLRMADVAARRAVSEAQSRDVSLAAARDTLTGFAQSIGAPPLEEGLPFDIAAEALEAFLVGATSRLEERLSMRRDGTYQIATIRSSISRRLEADASILMAAASLQRVDQSLERAQTLRDQGNAIRGAVDKVRSAIVRREFNDRLNRVWRDVFVRLAPSEPFLPAFRIPESSTQKLEPKLITEHRDGGEAGGTPGIMLSAGNLNTAALTLFIALHLSVPKELPWLILDDPVQSMDDVHVAQFAALLRTLSKEHGRQIIIAVHERQLFEYLKLELSPAFVGDSLLTLELSRGPRRDSICVSKRFSFKEETVILTAA